MKYNKELLENRDQTDECSNEWFFPIFLCLLGKVKRLDVIYYGKHMAPSAPSMEHYSSQMSRFEASPGGSVVKHIFHPNFSDRHNVLKKSLMKYIVIDEDNYGLVSDFLDISFGFFFYWALGNEAAYIRLLPLQEKLTVQLRENLL